MISKFDTIFTHYASSVGALINDPGLVKWAAHLETYNNGGQVSADEVQSTLDDTLARDRLFLYYEDESLVMLEVCRQKCGRSYIEETLSHEGDVAAVMLLYRRALNNRLAWLIDLKNLQLD